MAVERRVRVLFVCLGNICRSPTAQAVFESLAARRGLSGEIQADSCGIGDWHTGNTPDERATAAAARRGYDLSRLRARQVRLDDFSAFDYILAMDRDNLADLELLRPTGFRGHLGLFLAFAGDGAPTDVPDPYYGGDAGFDRVLDLVESASEGLLRALERDKQEQ